MVGLPRLLSRQLVIQLVLEVHLTRRLSDPPIESVEQWAVLLFDWIYLLLAPHVVVLVEVSVEVGFQLLVSNEAVAAVGALELDALIQFGDGDDVEPAKQR